MRKLIDSICGAVLISAHLLLHPLLRRRRRQWGAAAEERALRLPGDELVPDPQLTYDHAVSIQAPRSAVWPWLVQVGPGRGGFYSYEELENLVGCRMRNVGRSKRALRNEYELSRRRGALEQRSELPSTHETKEERGSRRFGRHGPDSSRQLV